NEDQIESAGHGADGSSSRRTAVELRLAGGERGQSYRAAADVNHLRVQPMLLEDPGILGDKKHAAPLVQSTIGDNDLCRRRSGKEATRNNHTETEEDSNGAKDGKPNSHAGFF